MKDPTGLHFETDRHESDGWEGSGSLCDSCLYPWPCAKYEKWISSNDYKILQLQQSVERLSDKVGSQAMDIRDLRETDRRTRLLITSGVIPAFNDLAEGHALGIIRYEVERDHAHLDTAEGTYRVPGLETFTVTYTSDTRTVVNGHAEARYTES